MARKQFDADFDGDHCGIVGGEMTSACCAGEGGYDPDFGPCREDASLVTGSEYDYLGHFRQDRYLEQGHNDIPPINQGMLQAGMSQGTPRMMPQQKNLGGGSGGLGSLLGGLLGGGTNGGNGDYGGS